MRTAKTLIRLGGCPRWSESSLGTQSLCWFCHVVAHLNDSTDCCVGRLSQRLVFEWLVRILLQQMPFFLHQNCYIYHVSLWNGWTSDTWKEKISLNYIDVDKTNFGLDNLRLNRQILNASSNLLALYWLLKQFWWIAKLYGFYHCDGDRCCFQGFQVAVLRQTTEKNGWQLWCVYLFEMPGSESADSQ